LVCLPMLGSLDLIWTYSHILGGGMTERNLTQELLYTYYNDMEGGDDIESIDYRSLIYILTELMIRIEKLEGRND